MDKHNRTILVGAIALAVGGCTPLAGVQLASGSATLQVVPHLVEGGYRAQALVSPWTPEGVVHVEIRLQTISPTGEEEPALLGGKPFVQDVAKAAFGAPFTLTGLEPNSRYRVRARAFKAAGSLPEDVISVASASFVDVALLADDRPTVATLSIQLQDVPFDGHGTVPGLDILPGGLVPVGSESLQLGDPVTE